MPHAARHAAAAQQAASAPAALPQSAAAQRCGGAFLRALYMRALRALAARKGAEGARQQRQPLYELRFRGSCVGFASAASRRFRGALLPLPAPVA